MIHLGLQVVQSYILHYHINLVLNRVECFYLNFGWRVIIFIENIEVMVILLYFFCLISKS